VAAGARRELEQVQLGDDPQWTLAVGYDERGRAAEQLVDELR